MEVLATAAIAEEVIAMEVLATAAIVSVFTIVLVAGEANNSTVLEVAMVTVANS